MFSQSIQTCSELLTGAEFQILYSFTIEVNFHFGVNHIFVCMLICMCEQSLHMLLKQPQPAETVSSGGFLVQNVASSLCHLLFLFPDFTIFPTYTICWKIPQNKESNDGFSLFPEAQSVFTLLFIFTSRQYGIVILKLTRILF